MTIQFQTGSSPQDFQITGDNSTLQNLNTLAQQFLASSDDLSAAEQASLTEAANAAMPQLPAGDQQQLLAWMSALDQKFGAPSQNTTADTDTDDDTALSFLGYDDQTGLDTDATGRLTGLDFSVTNSDGSTTSAQDSTNSTLAELNSTDSSQVLSALTTYINVGADTNLTTAQQADLTATLQTLAQTIAQANTSGGIAGLQAYDPAVIQDTLTGLVNTTGLSSDEQTALSSDIASFSSQLGSLNAASGNPPPTDPMIASLNSQDPGTVYNALYTLSGLGTQTGLTSDEEISMMSQLQTLSQQIAQQNAAGGSSISWMQSPDPETLSTNFLTLLGTTGDTTTQSLVATMMKTLSSNLAPINEETLYQQSLSTDPSTVSTALQEMANIPWNTTLSANDKAVAVNYLAIVAKALAFMSQMRASMTIMDSQLTESETQGKLATINNMASLALTQFQSSMQNVQSTLQSQLNQIQQQQLMQWLMPLVMVFAAIITVVITVATGGASTALGVALMVGMLAATSLTIANSSSNCLNDMCNSQGITDPAAQGAVSMGIQLGVMVLATICSLGASAGALAVEAGATAAEEITAEALASALKETFSDAATQAATQQTACQIGGLVLTTAFSSGLITTGFMDLIQACGEKDSEKASIAAMIMTIMLMILSLGALAKAGGAGDIAEEAAELGTSEDATASASSSTGGDDTTTSDASVGTSTASVSENEQEESNFISQMIQNVLKRVEASGKTFNTNTLLKILQWAESFAQAGASAEQSASYVKQGQIAQLQANTTQIQAQATALLSYLQQLVPNFDVVISDLNSDSAKIAEFVSDVVSLFSQMVQQASQTTGRLFHTG